MIVIDVGCARYIDEVGNEHNSLAKLIELYAPRILYAFDPNWDDSMLPTESKTDIRPLRGAVWSYDGKIGFRDHGVGSWITDQPDAKKVPCVDLAKFIGGLPDGDEIVLKLDVEGAEYELLSHLYATGTDKRLKTIWIEWHNFGLPCPSALIAAVTSRLHCEFREWRW